MYINRINPATLFGAFCLLLFGSGCELRQAMYDQEKYEPLEPSVFFEDGSSFRDQVKGSVARGQMNEDSHYHQGVVAGNLATTIPVAVTPEFLNWC